MPGKARLVGHDRKCTIHYSTKKARPIESMRKAQYSKLKKEGTPDDWTKSRD